MNSFPKADVLAACAKFGPQLQVDSQLDGVKVMAAIAGNESSYGYNCGPRHEPAYDVGGTYANGALQKGLLQEFGSAAACSYGPWQMMFDNFVGFTPAQLLTDLDACAMSFVRFFNSYVIRTRRAVTLDEIAQVWNSGHISATPSPAVQRYMQQLQKNYEEQA